MTRWNIYSCDCCGKELRFDAKSGLKKPHRIIILENGQENNKVEYDFCDECYATFCVFLEHPKEFGKLADKLCEKEEEESVDQ